MKRIDPVCHRELNGIQPSGHSYFKGKLFYFCSDTCKLLFKKAPRRYIGPEIESDEARDMGGLRTNFGPNRWESLNKLETSTSNGPGLAGLRQKPAIV
jgi:YHS domain-containing protein